MVYNLFFLRVADLEFEWTYSVFSQHRGSCLCCFHGVLGSGISVFGGVALLRIMSDIADSCTRWLWI